MIIFNENKYRWLYNATGLLTLGLLLTKTSTLHHLIVLILFVLGVLLINWFLNVHSEKTTKLELFGGTLSSHIGTTKDASIALDDIDYVYGKLIDEYTRHSHIVLDVHLQNGSNKRIIFDGSRERLTKVENSFLVNGINVKNAYNDNINAEYIIKGSRNNLGNQYSANVIPVEDRLFYGVLTLILLIAGALIIKFNAFPIITFSRRSENKGYMLHDEPLLIGLVALFCLILYLIISIVDHYDKRDNEQLYEYIKGLCIRLMFCIIYLAFLTDFLYYNVITVIE